MAHNNKPLVSDLAAFFGGPEQNAPTPSPETEQPAVSASAPDVPMSGESSPESSAPTKKPARGKKAKKEVRKIALGAYCTEEERYKMKLAALNQHTSVTDLVVSGAMDIINYTYACQEAACGCRFVLRSNGDDVPPKPACCPVCQSKKINRVRN